MNDKAFYYLVVCPFIAGKADITQPFPMGRSIPLQVPERDIPRQLSSKQLNSRCNFLMVTEEEEEVYVDLITTVVVYTRAS